MRWLTLIIAIFSLSLIPEMLHIARQPGGSLMYLAILFMGIALIGFYLGFVTFRPWSPEEFIFYPGSTAIAAGFFLVLALGVAYFAKQEIRDPEIISHWIGMYPNITDIEHVPVLHHDCLWKFLVKSNDPRNKVRAYYEDSAHSPNWDKVRHQTGGFFFTFEKPGYALSIQIFLGDFGKGSNIHYILEDDKHHR